MTFASGASKQAVVAFLRGEQNELTPGTPPPQTLAERIRWKAPYPLLRHHFGRPTVQETLVGVVDIARAESRSNRVADPEPVFCAVRVR